MRNDLVSRVTTQYDSNKWPQFKAGDTLGVYVKIKEGEKTRIQLFKGVVIKIQGSGATKSFTVRKMSGEVGVERTFPFASPMIDEIKLYSRGKVRRSRLFYLRGLRGRAARLESDLVTQEKSKKNAAASAE
ncbi:MAG: 50S ribosomal protein L19 [Bdellovibrionales bacterium]|nr:50S ribosomal protein L19 [Bdellovibrionales bacterium]